MIALPEATMPTHKVDLDRVPDLDGLRGIAILMVVLCHYVFAPDLGQVNPLSLRAFGFSITATGVDLFFVLSGYLIGGILLDHRSSGTYFKAFYGRRICRIIPVYYGFLILTGIAGVIQHAHGRSTPVFDAGTPYWMFFAFLQNFGLAWYGDWNWITVTMAWSLALEEQFYLSLPLATKHLSTKTLVRISILIILIAPIVRFLFPTTPRAIGALLNQAVHADGLAAGFLCAALVRTGTRLSSKMLTAAALLLGSLVVITYFVTPIGFLYGTTLALLYSCVLLLATAGVIAILRSAVLRFFGIISYTLYLVHQSALVFAHHRIRHSSPSTVGREAILVSAAALLVAIAGCWLSWVYFERPLIGWARNTFRY